MPQLKEYHRPASVAEALQLLARPGVQTAIIGGGTRIVAQLDESIDEVVDLQAAGLDAVEYTTGGLRLGAMVCLQRIVEDGQAPALLREAARREGPNTFRHAATIGGTVAQPDPSSELLAALLVFEAEVEIERATGEAKKLLLSEFLADVPAHLAGGIITAVRLATTGQTASDRVGRTPADQPIVAAAARRTEQGKVYLALAGVGPVPVLVEPDQVAGLSPAGDFRGSGEYRRQMAVILANRVMNEVGIT
jgi:CO/xanthine dehydrogenase FAD-binding subunit